MADATATPTRIRLLENVRFFAHPYPNRPDLGVMVQIEISNNPIVTDPFQIAEIIRLGFSYEVLA